MPNTAIKKGQNNKATAMGAPRSTDPKTNATKMHRRSRSGWLPVVEDVEGLTDHPCPGCFTCRLRRKKCDEGHGQCKACRNLGLKCEYKRPMWWSNNEQRKQQKEHIKNIIKRTKLSEKTAQVAAMGGDIPPGLSHSLPTSATYSDATVRTRAASEDSQYSLVCDFNQHPNQHFDIYQPHVLSPSFDTDAHYYPYAAAPYEVDIKTERQMYVNDVPTRRTRPHRHSALINLPRPTTSLHPYQKRNGCMRVSMSQPGICLAVKRDSTLISSISRMELHRTVSNRSSRSMNAIDPYWIISSKMCCDSSFQCSRSTSMAQQGVKSSCLPLSQ